jgi:hypothetical protein
MPPARSRQHRLERAETHSHSQHGRLGSCRSMLLFTGHNAQAILPEHSWQERAVAYGSVPGLDTARLSSLQTALDRVQ